jgi:hypothetical protein
LTRPLRAWPAALLLAGTLSVGSARADVVGPPPTSCPPGSTPESNHGGSYCDPADCEDGCAAGQTCQAAKLCLTRRTYRSRGGNEHMRIEVVGTCPVTGICAPGTCETLQVCVADAPKAPRRSCGCELAGAGGSASGLGLLLLCGALAGAARRWRVD